MTRAPEPQPGPRRWPRAFGLVEAAALAASLVWISCAAAVLHLGGHDDDSLPALRLAVNLLAALVPVALIWVAAAALRSARTMRAEATRLRAALDGTRKTHVIQAQAGTTARSVDRPAAPRHATPAQRRSPSQASQAQRRPAAAPAREAPQASLALDQQRGSARPALSPEAFILALNFPMTATDRNGFRALAAARRDPRAARLVQASQDVLTLLSEDGIYMDDLVPDRARPEIWRRFARGERGRAIADLGGVRDQTALALAAARMRQDTVFRDAAHHFLRCFDRTFAAFEPEVADAELDAFAQTRTARAFMLLGRVVGTFD